LIPVIPGSLSKDLYAPIVEPLYRGDGAPQDCGLLTKVIGTVAFRILLPDIYPQLAPGRYTLNLTLAPAEKSVPSIQLPLVTMYIDPQAVEPTNVQTIPPQPPISQIVQSFLAKHVPAVSTNLTCPYPFAQYFVGGGILQNLPVKNQHVNCESPEHLVLTPKGESMATKLKWYVLPDYLGMAVGTIRLLDVHQCMGFVEYHYTFDLNETGEFLTTLAPAEDWPLYVSFPQPLTLADAGKRIEEVLQVGFEGNEGIWAIKHPKSVWLNNTFSHAAFEAHCPSATPPP
jgi:hypothetical protein